MWIIKHYYQRKAWPSIFRPRPPTRIRILCDETEIFFSSVACRPHVSGENGHRKPVFSKTLSRVEIFENTGFLTTCRRTKTEVFQYDDVIHHNTTTSITHALWGLLWYFHRFSVFWWTDQNVSNTLRVDVNFFGHVGKNLRFSKISGYVWKGSKHRLEK